MGMANSLAKRARIDFFAKKAKDLAKEMEEYFFKNGIGGCGNEVNARKILRIVKENAESCSSNFPTNQMDSVIFMLSRHLHVTSVTLEKINSGDNEVKELCKSIGIN